MLRGDLNLDLPRLGFLAQREPYGQHAVPVLGPDLRGVHGRWQREGAAEPAVLPLDAVELLFFHVAGRLLLARDRQGAVVNSDVDVFSRRVRQLRFEHELVIAIMVDVDRRHPVARRHQGVFARTRAGISEHTVDAILQLRKVPKWIPTNDGHNSPSLGMENLNKSSSIPKTRTV